MIEAIYKLFNNLSNFLKGSFLKKKKISGEKEKENSQDKNNETEFVAENPKNELSVERRSLTTKLYMLEQEIEVLKKDFPDKYNEFLSQIEKLRETYNSCLEEVKAKLTFQINPEINGKINYEISELEWKIKKFIEGEVRFSVLLKRLQKMIVKMNILYNVLIVHPDESEKVISQVERAKKIEVELTREFKECEYALENIQRKERIVTLFSYVDYQILKIFLRSKQEAVINILKELVILTEFKGFDYVSAFKAFVEDEVSDLGELISSIVDANYKSIFEFKVTTLLRTLAHKEDIGAVLTDKAIWFEHFELESSLLEYLQTFSVLEKDKIKVKLINRMNIEVNDKDLIILPKTIAYMSLVSIFSTIHEDKIWLLIKMFKSISDEITYKEIYFILLLFDAIDIIHKIPNTLYRHIEKYITRYSYDSVTINKKKSYVFTSTRPKQYIKVFSIDEDYERINDTLMKLNIDFKMTQDSICINAFYFKGLESVFDSVCIVD